MFKPTALVTAAVLVLTAPSRPGSTAGSWQVDAHHSDAQIITDAATNYGKTKIDTTLGFARVNGLVRFDDADPAKSSVDLAIYPAASMLPPIDEDGKFQEQWLSNYANNTLICFHSKGATRRPDGRLQTAGDLVLTRVDRNVTTAPGEAYAGPVYGPPIIHRVSRQVTLVLNLQPADAKDQKDDAILMSASTSLAREDFPQLVKAVVSTHWPVVVQDASCKTPAQAGEDYHGPQCTGVFLAPPPLPQPPESSTGEDYPTRSTYNTIVGNHLTILAHLRLTPKGPAMQASLAK